MRWDGIWYGHGWIPRLLSPLSWLFCGFVWLRRLAYRIGLLTVHRVAVPVIVVGNISVGGTGKTPLLVWLAGFLRSRGWRPGIVSRGYGGSASQWPQRVTGSSDPAFVGDEPVLLARRTDCPTWVGPDRVSAARALLAHSNCDIVLSDDGMQHYALGRDIEIAVIDGVRRHGNGLCLPGGPLREPVSRLRDADVVICNGGSPGTKEFAMSLQGESLVNLQDPFRTQRLAVMTRGEVVAVAGIGNPGRFFGLLRSAGLQVIERAFPDHHRYAPNDFAADEQRQLIMTEKDAVKCEGFASPNWWFLPVEARLDARFTHRFDVLLKGLNDG